MLGRQTPWKPSQPAMTSHSSSCSRALVAEADARPLRLEIVHARRRRPRRAAAPASSRALDQVLHDLRLAVDDDAAPAGELAQRMRCRSPSNCSSMPWWTSPSRCMRSPDPGVAEQLGRSPARARPRGRGARRTRGCAPRARPTRCPRGAAAARASGPRARRRRSRPASASVGGSRSSRTRWATANAPLAAGTPQ